MTSIRHRLLIDECLPPKIISIYLSGHINLSGDGVAAVHIKDYLGDGKKDPAWVPKIARDQRWCVLSKDKGANSTRLDALPIICAEHNVTLIRISEALKVRGLAFYGPQIISHWAELVAAMEGPKGAQYFLRLEANGIHTRFLATSAPDGYRIESGILMPDRPAMTA